MHIDADAFFASCEQAIHPELKGMPRVLITETALGIPTTALTERAMNLIAPSR